jgi:hypothetical protein
MAQYRIDPFGQLLETERWIAADKLNRQQIAKQNALRDIQQQQAEIGLRQSKRGEQFQNALVADPVAAQRNYPILYKQTFPTEKTKPVLKDLGEGDYGPAGLYDVTDIRNPVYVGASQKKQPLVSMGPGETEYDKKLGAGLAEEYLTIQRNASDALTNKARYARARQLINQAKGKTGALGETKLAAKRLGKAFGLDVGDVGPLEALKGMSVDLTMDVVQKTKGAVSNKEMELFAQTAPGLSNTYEGNLLLLDMYDRLADLKQQEAKLARKYQNRKGRFDSGYYEELAKFHEENKLFTPEIESRVKAVSTPAVKTTQTAPKTGFENISNDELLKGF